MLKRIYIEISNICNLQCSFCPVVDRDNEVMGLQEFENILEQASPLAEEVCLHLMGEPLAHPEFSKLLSICEKYETPIQLTTNGIVIQKRKEDILNCKVIRQINFSIQSYKDNFPGKPIDEYINSIFDFTKEAFEKRPEMYINYRLWNVGRNEIVERDNEDIFNRVENVFNTEINRTIHVESIKSKKVLNRLYLHFDSHFDWPSMDLPLLGKSGRCHALINHIGIHADGTVVPCCLDKEAQIPLGNCLTEDLGGILNSDRAIKMKRGFQNNQLVEDLCQRCSYIKRFNK
ncbi:MAG: radical SAM protein [Bacteriovoracaceae bacterium]|nr:radical SAM protein [Bacteriovoracaceae bacterium]